MVVDSRHPRVVVAVSQDDPWLPVGVVIVITLVCGAFLGGYGLGSLHGFDGARAADDDPFDDGPARVNCTTFLDASGNASGICFVSGDVRFEWIGDDDLSFYGNTTNGTVTLEDLPVDNSTVRREP